MNIRLALQSLLFISIISSGLHAQDNPFTPSFDMSPVDMDIFLLVKDELESTKKILVDIQNSQDMDGVIKEITYIVAALIIGTGLIVSPTLLFWVIYSYVMLKILTGQPLFGSEKDAHHIKESLADIGQTINKLSYEIRKMDHLIQLTQQPQRA